MPSRRHLFSLLASVLVVGVAAAPSLGEEPPPGVEQQRDAAQEVLAQIESTDGSLSLDSIDALDELGPPPWLSLGRTPDDAVVDAWLEVVKQLPPEDLLPVDRQRQPAAPGGAFVEAEAAGTTGANDTAATGEHIADFGTGDGEQQVMTITGWLSGADVQLPGDLDCPSVEDDGAIPLANARNGTWCGGEIGDGPHGDTTGDVDFFSLGEIEAGWQISLQQTNRRDSLDPVHGWLGLYDGDGNLLAQAAPENPDLPRYLRYEVAETGVYYGAIAGCCEPPADPFDPASGPGVTETGTYELSGSVLPPPCTSREDDGSIAQASPTHRLVTGEVFCGGEIGDGPYGTTSGDTDFYDLGPLDEGDPVVIDQNDYDVDSGAIPLTFGLYDASGTLVASLDDGPGNPDWLEVTVPATGRYYAGVAACCELPADPFDPASGAGAAETGAYSVYFRLPRPSPLPAAAAAPRPEDPALDTDYYLVDLDEGDAISGGFDSARVAGVIAPDGEITMSARHNPSFGYPADSPLRHARRVGFDHVAGTSGVHAIFVSEGIGAYEGELRAVRAGQADASSPAHQVIYLDFDGAEIPPWTLAGGTVPASPAVLSPMTSFLDRWDLAPGELDAVIDATIDVVVENLSTDLQVHDGRQGALPRGRNAVDVEILNSRDHGPRWGDPGVSRIVIGGTVEELGTVTVGIAQSIDVGNTDTTETGVVLLDLLSGPAGDSISVNTYQQAGTSTKVDVIGFAVGHIAAHEAGHLLGNWHTEHFNGQPSIMDTGGEVETIMGVGPDHVFGTADDPDPDFAVDTFDPPEGYTGIEDTAARSAHGLSSE